ncbi:homeobox-leucine zipper protein HOX11-like [Chenopodium quinoa]|uniref:homeobox-leucine zipper protein HOX11-like n=1 Tax=Chenopodium quinoa TaxID=63459 RepID=UPI000B79759E|nr:homeobox-leucine zipper protein HOX11-like [Chenopodium quinoa]
MELALSLGNRGVESNSAGYCMGSSRSTAEKEEEDDQREINGGGSSSSSDPSRLQLDLLPLSPVPRSIQPPPPLRFPWLTDNLSSEPGSSDGPGSKIMDPNRRPAVETTAEEVEEQSSPNSGTSSFMEFSLYTSNNNNKRGNENNNNNNNYGQEMIGATTSKGSDDEENGSTRKKLRLSKEQSAFLEESFKEHHTLNPKQKLALAKQLNLRPRQVEVWFQNRRARTKLKQTEVDCEYLKRCCETLTEENRRLQKELQELRALKTSQPFYMQLPATTLTMCPSCERVAPTSTTTSTPTVAASASAPAPAPATPTPVVAKPTAAVTVATNGTAAASGDNNASTNNDHDDDNVTLSLGKPKVSMLPFCNGKAHQAAS